MATRRTLRFDPIEEAGRNWTERGWGDAAVGMATVTSIMRAQQIVLARVHAALVPFELTFAQYEALMLLSFTRRGCLPLGKIGQRLQVHPASVTNVIDRLEGKGFVERRPHPDDQRATLASITRKGRNAASKATIRLNSDVFQDLGLGRGEQEQLIGVITEMRRSAGDFGD